MVNQKIQEKYDKNKLKDPHPSIEASLLNPQDIEKYIDSTGMIEPFDKKNLKSATYGVPLLGDVYYWEYDKKCKKYDKKCKKLKTKDDYFELKPNAIVYVHVSTIFRVPYYMVFRFNLKIDLVHKGLLLGTGPVVDPGFQGRLFIPIHNLTTNTYNLRAEEVFIWVEVTKMSKFDNNITKPPYKMKNLLSYTANDYFNSTNNLNPIVSSIPDAMEKANKNSEKALSRTTRLQWGATIGIVAIVIACLALVVTIIQPTISLVDTYSNKLLDCNNSLEKQNKKIDNLQKEIIILKKKIDENSSK